MMQRLVRLPPGVASARSSGSLRLLLCLLLPVPFLLVGHQLRAWDVAGYSSTRWSVNADRSYIEMLGYLQLLVAIVVLLVVWRRSRGRVYVAWAAALTVVLLDDAVQLHERLGMWLVLRGVALPGLPDQAVGELVAWGLMGLAVLAVLVPAHRASPAGQRNDSWRLALLVLVLMVFAVGVDTAHSVVEGFTDSTRTDTLISFLEATGELAAMSGLLVYAVRVHRRGRTA